VSLFPIALCLFDVIMRDKRKHQQILGEQKKSSQGENYNARSSAQNLVLVHNLDLSLFHVMVFGDVHIPPSSVLSPKAIK